MNNEVEWSEMSKYEKLAFIYRVLAAVSSLGLQWSALQVLKKSGMENLILSLDVTFYGFLVLVIIFMSAAMWSKTRQNELKRG